MYASHLINGLSSTTIGGKTPLEVWSEKATQGHDLLREFESGLLSCQRWHGESASKEVYIFWCQEKYERLQVMGP